MRKLLKAMTGPERKLTKAGGEAIRVAGRQNMIQDVEELEQRAHHLGMHVTARALNNAKNALGWEMAGDLISAGKAAEGKRP